VKRVKQEEKGDESPCDREHVHQRDDIAASAACWPFRNVAATENASLGSAHVRHDRSVTS